MTDHQEDESNPLAILYGVVKQEIKDLASENLTTRTKAQLWLRNDLRDWCKEWGFDHNVIASLLLQGLKRYGEVHSGDEWMKQWYPELYKEAKYARVLTGI